MILFARNIQSREQVTALNAQIRQASANLLIAVDQEGGRVQRLRDGFTPLPPMQLLADSVVQNPEVGVQLVRDTGWLMASEVFIPAALRFSWNLSRVRLSTHPVRCAPPCAYLRGRPAPLRFPPLVDLMAIL